MRAATPTRETDTTSSNGARTGSRGVGLRAPGHGISTASTQAPESRATAGRTAGPLLQRKLTINEPGDRYEQEADRVAELVIHGSEPPTPLGRASPPPRSLQRVCACGGICADCREEQTLQRMQAPNIPIAGGGQPAPPIVHEVLRSPGQPLDPQTRAFMEPRFGRSFENVRLHVDARAAESARAVNARAFTVGPNIVFGGNQPAADSVEHRRLLAHELVHVVQQDGVRDVAGGGAAVRLHAAPTIQRDVFDTLSEQDRKRLMNANAQCGSGQCHPARTPANSQLSNFASPPLDANAMAKWLGAGQPPPAKSADTPSQPPSVEKKAHAPVPPRPGTGKPGSPPERLQGLLPEMSQADMLRLAKDMSAADAARRREESQKVTLADGTVISLAPPPPQPAKPVIPPAKPGELTRDLEVTLDAGGKTAVIAKANVEGERARIIHNLDGELHRIEDITSMCRTAAHKFLDEWPILRRLADLTGGANPPSDAIWVEVDRQIEKSRLSIRQGSLADALESAEQANRSLRNAQATWGRYKERNLGGAETLLTTAETTRDASKYTLMALATVASGGTATLVAVAATSAIDVADAVSRAALGEKVDWGSLALDVVINIVTAKFGGKLSQRMLGKLLVNPKAQGIATRYLIQAIHSVINGAESRLIRGYIQGLYKTVTTSLTADEFIDQLLQQLFDPKSIAIDTILGLGRGYAVGRPPTATPASKPNAPPPAAGDESQGRQPSKPAATHQAGEPQSPDPAAQGQQRAQRGGAETGEPAIAKEKAQAIEPVVDPQSHEKHEIVGTKEGLGRCSASPCPAISVVYAKELAENPDFAARYKKIRKVGETDVNAATKEAAALASDIEAYKHAAAQQAAAVQAKLAPQITEVQAELKQARESTVDYQAARKAAGRSLKGGPIKGIWNAKERLWILMRQIAYPNRTILEQARITGVKAADGTVRPISSISGTGRTPDFVEVRGSDVVGGDLKSSKELTSSVKGGLYTDQLEGEFRGSSKVGGQHEVEAKIIKAAADSKGVIVLEGTNVLTGQAQTIEVPADKYRSEVLTYDEVRPN